MILQRQDWYDFHCIRGSWLFHLSLENSEYLALYDFNKNFESVSSTWPSGFGLAIMVLRLLKEIARRLQ